MADRDPRNGYVKRTEKSGAVSLVSPDENDGLIRAGLKYGDMSQDTLGNVAGKVAKMRAERTKYMKEQ